MRNARMTFARSGLRTASLAFSAQPNLLGAGMEADTVSESGTSTDRGRDDTLDGIAAALGLRGVADLYQDRVRVDRRKMEHMILGDDDSLEDAETFFRKIMEETRTHVSWPQRLKIGAKSKRDPHVLISGRPADVKMAKKMVMAVLDTWSQRVTMKMDVSYAYHSHIIGRNGMSIRHVMEDTCSHIHFPDSNRNNVTEKSNQVSIAGELSGVERARERIRNLMPVVFSFQLPIVGTLQSLPDPSSPFLQQVQQQYNVQVMFRTCTKLHGTQVLVKGCESEVVQVQEATVVLVKHLCHPFTREVPIQMTLEVSLQHHQVVLGPNCSNIKLIMSHTHTQIMVADANDPNIPVLKKSNITITGRIDDVYLARQQLVGSLPLVVIFELPHDVDVDSSSVDHVARSMDVCVTIRHKLKQKTLFVVIKGIERNASNIYEARRMLFNLNEPRVTAQIPLTYHIPNAPPVFKGQAGVTDGKPGRFPLLFPLAPTSPIIPSPPLLSPTVGSPWFELGVLPLFGPQTPSAHLQEKLRLHQLLPPVAPSIKGSSGYGSHSSLVSLRPSSKNSNNCSTVVNSNSSSVSTSPRPGPQGGQWLTSEDSTSNDFEFGDKVLNMLDVPDRRAPGCEKKSRELAVQRCLTPHDYERRKQQAYRAMEKQPVPGELRVPTPAWAGYGFSQSSAVPGTSCDLKTECPDLELWKSAPSSLHCDFGSVSASGDSKQTRGLHSGTSCNSTSTTPPLTAIGNMTTDIVDLFLSLGLEKYTAMFLDHEVDLDIFLTLNDKDLHEMGVSAFGARRKMLNAIAEMKKWQNLVGCSSSSDSSLVDQW